MSCRSRRAPSTGAGSPPPANLDDVGEVRSGHGERRRVAKRSGSADTCIAATHVMAPDIAGCGRALAARRLPTLGRVAVTPMRLRSAYLDVGCKSSFWARFLCAAGTVATPGEDFVGSRCRALRARHLAPRPAARVLTLEKVNSCSTKCWSTWWSSPTSCSSRSRPWAACSCGGGRVCCGYISPLSLGPGRSFPSASPAR